MRADRAVEPTKSENITVTWRRSAASLGDVSITGTASAGAAFASASARRTAMASSSVRRCPTMTTPRSFKSSAVKRGRTFSLIALSRNIASYCSRPRCRSQPPRSMIVPELNPARMIIQVKQGVQGTAHSAARSRGPVLDDLPRQTAPRSRVLAK